MDVEVQAKGPLQAIDCLLANLKNFPSAVADELTNWQKEDMNRVKYVNTSLVEDTASTIITQHTQGQLVVPRMSQRARYSRRKARAAGKPWHHWHHGKKYQDGKSTNAGGKVTRTYRRRVREAKSRRHHQQSSNVKPILRPALREEMVARMDKLMNEKLNFNAD